MVSYNDFHRDCFPPKKVPQMGNRRGIDQYCRDGAKEFDATPLAAAVQNNRSG